MTQPLAEIDSEASFTQVLLGEDELGVVVRAHIRIEALLIQLLEQMVHKTKYLNKLELDYAGRVNLAVALGLKASFASPLLALGTLRNSFAHQPNTLVDKNRIDSLYKSLGEDEKEVVQESFLKTKSLTASKGKSFRALVPKDQFILIAVTLRSMLKAAITQVNEAADA